MGNCFNRETKPVESNIIWIDENKINKYIKDVESIDGLEIKLFLKVNKAIKYMKKIKFEETKVIISDKLFSEFVITFKENILDMFIAPRIIIFSNDKNKFIANNKEYQDRKNMYYKYGGIENKIDNIKDSSPNKTNLNSISHSYTLNNQLQENDQKLKNSLQAYKNLNKKNDNTSLNTLYKLRSILLNLLKDKEQDLEYSKFITEKKLKYMIKNKERSESRIKVLESELKIVEQKIEELEKNLGEIYIFYDEEELKEDIKRFENSNEVKSGKFSKTLEQLETMKKMLPFVSEYGKAKDKKNRMVNEIKELGKIIKNSGQTISILNNYYKNIKKKINE